MGKQELQSIWTEYYKRADCVIICYDISIEDPFETLDNWKSQIEQHADDHVVVIVIGCKLDNVRNHKRTQLNMAKIESILEQSDWRTFNAISYECSSKTGYNVDGVFRKCAKLILNVRRSREKEQEMKSMQQKLKYATQQNQDIKKEDEKSEQQQSLQILSVEAEKAPKLRRHMPTKHEHDESQNENDILEHKLNEIQKEKKELEEKLEEMRSKLMQLQQASNPIQDVEKVILNKILVVIICVEMYENKRMSNLPGTSTDKARLVKVIHEQYKYDIIMNKDPTVTAEDVKDILQKAEDRFSNDKYGYDAIFVCFSGHGNHDNLLLSDFDGRGKGIYNRIKFESHFNASRIEKKSQCHKFYFMDSCRGEVDSEMIKTKVQIPRSKGNDAITFKFTHPEANKSVMHSNADSYRSYEVPYDEKCDDINTTEMYNDDYEGKYCGLFMNSLYHTLLLNAKEEFNYSYSDIQDILRDNAQRVVPVKGDQDRKVGLQINESGNLKNKIKKQIVFLPDSQSKYSSKDEKKTEHEEEIAILNLTAQKIDGKNVEYK